MSATVWLTLGFIALLTWIILRYISSSYKRTEVFKTMGIKFIPPLESRWRAQKNMFFKINHTGALDAKQVDEHGTLFGKLEVNTEPVVIIAEPDLLRDILVKQFNSFCNRRELPGGASKLFHESLLFLRDQRWREIRSLISPTFSTAKLHSMDGFINDCLKIMQLELNGRLAASKAGSVEIDAKNYFSNFAMDVVGTVFFGVGVDAITNREHPFVKHAFEIFRGSNLFRILLFLLTPGKALRKQLIQRGFIGMPKSSREYFEIVIPGIVTQRRKNMTENVSQQRKDFISVLISAREKAVSNEAMTATGNLRDEKDDDANINAGANDDYKANGHTELPRPLSETPSQNGSVLANGHKMNGARSVTDANQAAKTATTALTDDEIAGQIFIFLVAGYETTASTIGFLFHELALNQDVQDRLRSEITDNLGESKQLNYDSVAKLRLLDACISETLRLYPPLSRLERQCMEDCTLSNGLQIKKGVIVGIPAWYIHRSPDNFVDPEKFDPDRFYDAERRAQIKPYTYMPFGQGPRNCVGMRFALLELKMVTAFVVQNYRIVPTEKTVHPIPLEGGGQGLTRPKLGAFVGVEQL